MSGRMPGIDARALLFEIREQFGGALRCGGLQDPSGAAE
jgi:hypothetical protein